jgi:DNA-binding response OmpR family regulator
MKIAWYVDDDADMIQAVSLMMKLLDFEVKPFLTARAAAAELKEFRPHLLILDLNMPEISGLDLLEFVRRRPELDDLPILMLTSEHTDAKIDQAMERGANGYVLKPVTLEELEAAIIRVMA